MAEEHTGSSVEVLLSPGNPWESLRDSTDSTAVPSSPESSAGGGAGWHRGVWHQGGYGRGCSDGNASARAAIAARCRENLGIAGWGSHCNTSWLSGLAGTAGEGLAVPELTGPNQISPSQSAHSNEAAKMQAKSGYPSSAHASYREDVDITKPGEEINCELSPQSSHRGDQNTSLSPGRSSRGGRSLSSPRKPSPRKSPRLTPRGVREQPAGSLWSFPQAAEAAPEMGLPFSTYSERRRASDMWRSEALRQLQVAHHERASKLAAMAARTPPRIEASLSGNVEEARAQLSEERKTSRSIEAKRLQFHNQEREAQLSNAQPRIDNSLPSGVSNPSSPMRERSFSSSHNGGALAAHRRHLREITSNAKPRVVDSLSPQTEEFRQHAAEQRMARKSSQEAVMRNRELFLHDLTGSAKPRVTRELSPEANARRTDSEHRRASARTQDGQIFSARKRNLRQMRQKTPARVETTLSSMTADERLFAESMRQQRLQTQHSEMREHSRSLRDLVSARSSVVDPYIDAEIRAKIRKDGLPKANTELSQKIEEAKVEVVQPLTNSFRASAGTEKVFITEEPATVPAQSQPLWHAVQNAVTSSATLKDQEHILQQAEAGLKSVEEHCDRALMLYGEADDLEKKLSRVSREMQGTSSTLRNSLHSASDAADGDAGRCGTLELATLHDELRAQHQDALSKAEGAESLAKVREWQSAALLAAPARSATPDTRPWTSTQWTSRDEPARPVTPVTRPWASTQWTSCDEPARPVTPVTRRADSTFMRSHHWPSADSLVPWSSLRMQSSRAMCLPTSSAREYLSTTSGSPLESTSFMVYGSNGDAGSFQAT